MYPRDSPGSDPGQAPLRKCDNCGPPIHVISHVGHVIRTACQDTMTLSLMAGKNSERKNQRVKQKQPTIRDVAARAGVSHQTVSRVINGDASVRPGTRALVQKAIEDMKYVPNPMARGLISNRTHCIGMVTTNVSDHSFA